MGTAINLSEWEPTHTCVWRPVYAKNENRTKERVYASEHMGRRVCAHGDALALWSRAIAQREYEDVGVCIDAHGDIVDM